MRAMNFLKRVIGIAEFKRGSDIIDFLREMDSTQNFDKHSYLLLANSDEYDFKLWLIASQSYVYVVIDDGFTLKMLLKRAKDEFSFTIVKEGDSPRMYINETVTTIPIDSALTGSFESTRKSIENFIA